MEFLHHYHPHQKICLHLFLEKEKYLWYYDPPLTNRTGPSFCQIFLILLLLLLTTAIFIICIIFLVLGFSQLQTISSMDTQILQQQLEIIELFNEANNVSFQCSLNENEVETNITLFCSLNITFLLENLTNASNPASYWWEELIPPLAFSADLIDKLERKYILFTEVCIEHTVVYLIMNNLTNVYPISTTITNDQFTYGLPNLCAPGTNDGQKGFSPSFMQEAEILILQDGGNINHTIVFNAAVHYDSDSIAAQVGLQFFDPNSNPHTQKFCYTCELYCYGDQPIYVYALIF